MRVGGVWWGEWVGKKAKTETNDKKKKKTTTNGKDKDRSVSLLIFITTDFCGPPSPVKY